MISIMTAWSFLFTNISLAVQEVMISDLRPRAAGETDRMAQSRMGPASNIAAAEVKFTHEAISPEEIAIAGRILYPMVYQNSKENDPFYVDSISWIPFFIPFLRYRARELTGCEDLAVYAQKISSPQSSSEWAKEADYILVCESGSRRKRSDRTYPLDVFVSDRTKSRISRAASNLIIAKGRDKQIIIKECGVGYYETDEIFDIIKLLKLAIRRDPSEWTLILLLYDIYPPHLQNMLQNLKLLKNEGFKKIVVDMRYCDLTDIEQRGYIFDPRQKADIIVSRNHFENHHFEPKKLFKGLKDPIADNLSPHGFGIIGEYTEHPLKLVFPSAYRGDGTILRNSLSGVLESSVLRPLAAGQMDN